MKSMKAVIYDHVDKIEHSPLKFLDYPMPEHQSNEVRIKISACGVCHTDLHEVEGDLPPRSLPRIPGHQIVGFIESVGEKVIAFRPGDRVGVSWLYSTCHLCKYCHQYTENLCENAQFTGYDVNGGYAEYCVVPQEFVYPIPDIFSEINAAPLLFQKEIS